MRRVPCESIILAALVVACAVGGEAQIIGGMNMRGAGGTGGGGASASLTPEQIKTLSGWLAVVSMSSSVLDAGIARNEVPGVSRAELAEVRDLARRYQRIFGTEAITDSDRAHHLIRDDVLPVADVRLRALFPAVADPNSFKGKLLTFATAPGHKANGPELAANLASEKVEARITSWVAILGVLAEGFPADPVSREQAQVAASVLVAAVKHMQEITSLVPQGNSIVSPHEPYLKRKGQTTLGVTYRYWPYNRENGEKTPKWSSGVFDLDASYAVSNAVTLGVTLPVVALANSPEGMPDRKTGLSDLQLRGQWWINEGRNLPVDVGLELQARLPTGNDGDGSNGAGLGTTEVRWDAKLAYQPYDRAAPRMHVRVGREWDLDADKNLGITEYVFGVLWNRDPWRDDGADLRAPRTHNYGTWIDVAGTVMDEAAVMDGMTMKSAWELRLGFAWQATRRANTPDEIRYTFSGEVHRPLAPVGLSSSLSAQGTFNVSWD